MAEFELDSIWRELLAATPITIAVLDHERRIRYANLIAHGYGHDEVIGVPIDRLLPLSDRSRITGLIDEVLRTGEQRTYETRLVTPRGLVLFFVRLSALVIDGVIRYAILVSFDVSEEHEKRKLREREHALLAALEPVNRILLSTRTVDPMFERLLNEILTLFDCDRAFLGYPCDPSAAEFTVVHEQTVPEFRRPKGLKLPVDAVLARRLELALSQPGGVVRHDPECNPVTRSSRESDSFQVRSMLLVAVHTDLDKPWMLGIHHCRAPRVYDAEIAILSAIAARVSDVLRTWKTQETMRQSEQRLHHQLAQAQKMQAIGQLTGGVAHDFNNLLTVIGGGLEMLDLESNPDPNIRSYGLMALDACRRAAALTQRLLAFSRQQPLRPRATDIERLLRSMEGLLRRTLGATIQIEVLCSADLWLCEVDPAQLESAILNLSINARDAMTRGGQLTIDACNVTLDAGASAGEELTPGDYVRVSVTDEGTGIAPELLSQVFEPFFTTKEVGKGSGLGLSMVYGFAKQSRGQVKIHSQLGHGTTVRLFLPRSQSNTANDTAQPPAQDIPRGARELVLVVEDDANLRTLAVELLQRLGYRTLAVGEAAAALELLVVRADVSLLLADIVLPGGKNGAQLAREVQQMRPGLPVLFMSGYTESAVIHDGRLDEGVRLLEKPFTTSALAHAVRKALDGTE